MRKITITKITLDNFKKFKHLELDFENKTVNLEGRNEVGKTTVIDAFFWCLFDKNSLGNTKFSVKPIINGKELHNVQTAVEIEFSINGTPRTYRRELEEVWTRKRGSVDLTFDGHISNYYVNTVLKTLTKYKEDIEDCLVDEKNFKLLTNVNAFTSLKWEEQRRILFELVNANVDGDRIIEENQLFALKSRLESSLTFDEILSMAKADKKKANEILERTPIEIQTLESRKFDIPNGFTKEQFQTTLDKVTKEKEDLMSELTNISNSDAIKLDSKLVSKVKELNTKLRENQTEYADYKNRRSIDRNTLCNNANKKMSELEFFVELNNGKLEQINSQIEANTAKREELVKAYEELQQTRFNELELVCPTCGQHYPEEKAEELKKNFNDNKANELMRLDAEISKLEQEVIGQLGNDYHTLKVKVEDANKEYNNIKSNILSTLKEFDAETEKVEAAFETVEKDLNKEIEKNERLIKKEESKQSVNPELEAKKQEIQERIKKCEARIQKGIEIISQINLKEQDEKDIKVKKELLDENSKLYDNATRLEFECEKFERIKAEQIESQINDKFEFISFKLFEQQINGGIKPTCCITVDGVPYADVNNAGKINAGLDVIKKIQNRYGIQAPIFLDNAESVSDWKVNMNGTQLLRFYVSEEERLVYELEEN